jgi:hypothetical protein
LLPEFLLKIFVKTLKMDILIKDERLNGTIIHQFEMQIEGDTLTAKELIEKRVYSEVQHYNSKLTEYFNGLVKPTEAEQTLNGYKLKKQEVIDAEKQVYIALNAFQQNRFFILVDDKQIEELDQKISLHQYSNISFVKLTPLIGG